MKASDEDSDTFVMVRQIVTDVGGRSKRLDTPCCDTVTNTWSVIEKVRCVFDDTRTELIWRIWL